ncbi:hypothetical protein KGY58_05385 [Candidatus Bipolaricaulota bacterium]|nr:hypothetical protein [Candidatus Bipolaricaulota bacterium]MBS3825958.1 hypothetical protein [Candidatus Bipolaricaulota bacterium]
MSIIRQISYTYFLGFPVIAYVGILTYVLLVLTSLTMILNRKRLTRFPLKYHSRLALLTFLSASVHAVMAISLYV